MFMRQLFVFFKSGFDLMCEVLQGRRRVHFLIATALLALYFTTVSNLSFWGQVNAIFEQSPYLPFLFKLSVPLCLYFLMCAVMIALCSWKALLKPLGILLLMTCAGATYGSLSYGIIFDDDMLLNFLETNLSEAASYLSLSSVAAVPVLGAVPSLLLVRLKIYYPSFIKASLERLGAFALLMLAALWCIIPFYQEYSFIGRNNRNLHKEILPVTYVYAAASLALSSFKTPMPYVALGQGAKTKPHDKPVLMFLVIGETARAANFSALGYGRPTNQYTDKERVITFANVKSCGTATAYSLPCMFSDLGRADFSLDKAQNREGVLDVIQKAGYAVTWLDNDSGCKGVCDRVTNFKIKPDDKKHCNGSTCYDEIFTQYAEDLTQNIEQDTLIAFHLIGSHGPRYYERYPLQYQIFTPLCDRPDVENCRPEEAANAYDNTILYTDKVIYDLINVLETRMDKADPMLVYISDHGESLGENGVYLHGLPYAIAPREQTQVPLQMWLPDKTAAALRLDKKCLREEAQNGSFSHDNFFHTLLGLLQIDTPEYKQDLDLLRLCS